MCHAYFIKDIGARFLSVFALTTIIGYTDKN